MNTMQTVQPTKRTCVYGPYIITNTRLHGLMILKHRFQSKAAVIEKAADISRTPRSDLHYWASISNEQTWALLEKYGCQAVLEEV